ncbi:ATP-binding cassette domain-containing protein [Microbacterium sp. zg.Y625]|uniref:ABC transporter ATP-binding protein n=1 Tax=Microbacterium jiangjiandongii TaxID=3049071 RepID=UPI00214BD641|nr:MULTISPECIES: ATP-binding cassette domain-containing protein [unclassified Microbacterium]MCR2793421.1 ATP-binding cassette domain-containing protein [Microbacterium sp. zg.Y625]WIM25208.1 ATP-binding cassette domain-containing protein [Microbacterium sp. zg-Y625]
MPASPAASPAAVEARGWGWRYATREAWAVRDVSLRVEPGERVLLLGASGSGKSTLLQGIAGVLGGADEGDQEGALFVGGQPAAATRGTAGLVLQDPDSQTILARVGDDVAFGCENLGVPREEIWQRVHAALDAVGLDVPLDRSTSALSGGQKQRLALAGVIAMRPGAVLLDEPTANLDPAGVVDVRDAVGRALDATGATLIVIEHRVDVWLPLVDRVVVLAPGGGVLADGSPRAVLGSGVAIPGGVGPRGPARSLAGHGATAPPPAAAPATELDLPRQLAAAGVWVPGFAPRVPPPPAVAPGEALLSARGLVVARTPGVPVAGPLDLEVRAGEVLGVVGPNGAGKSTLGLTLAGLVRPEAGRVGASDALAAGAAARRRRADAGTDPAGWSSRSLLTRIGTVFQDPEHQLLARTVREELAVGPRALGLPEAEVAARVDELLERLRLARLADANPYTLSGGEKRRLTVAATLATRPRVMVLDEPTFGQDATTWAELVAIIAGLRDGIDERGPLAIAAISHDEAVLAALHARRLEVGR